MHKYRFAANHIYESMLDPFESGAFIAAHSQDVSIKDEGLSAAVELIVERLKCGDVEDTDWAAQELHPKTRDAAAADWVLVVDALNFSFWSEPGAKWVLSFHGTAWTGYFAACAAVNRALENGIPITDPKFYAQISLEQVREIFVDDKGTPIPLLEERHRILQETGKILLEKFNGSFLNAVSQCGNSAKGLLELILTNFPSFRDEAEFGGRKVGLYKRAQILVADTWRALDAPFADISTISVFADYRVPQVLAFLGALEYSAELRRALDAKELLPPGSPREVQIRGATIHACHLITVELQKRLAAMGADRPTAYAEINDIVVDNFLWCFRRTKADEIEAAVPFHRTRGIYY